LIKSRISENSKGIENENKKNNKLDLSWQPDSRFKLRKGLKIKLDCEFCGGPILAEQSHMFSGLQIMRDFSAALHVCLVTSKSMLEE
jgi:hypothetical protein